MNNKFTFALPSSYDQYCVKSFTKQVKTLAFAKKYKIQLANTASKLTTSNIDLRMVIGNMLQVAYGRNIGLQIDEKLSDEDLIKIKGNILKAVYYY